MRHRGRLHCTRTSDFWIGWPQCGHGRVLLPIHSPVWFACASRVAASRSAVLSTSLRTSSSHPSTWVGDKAQSAQRRGHCVWRARAAGAPRHRAAASALPACRCCSARSARPPPTRPWTRGGGRAGRLPGRRGWGGRCPEQRRRQRGRALAHTPSVRAWATPAAVPPRPAPAPSTPSCGGRAWCSRGGGRAAPRRGRSGSRRRRGGERSAASRARRRRGRR